MTCLDLSGLALSLKSVQISRKDIKRHFSLTIVAFILFIFIKSDWRTIIIWQQSTWGRGQHEYPSKRNQVYTLQSLLSETVISAVLYSTINIVYPDLQSAFSLSGHISAKVPMQKWFLQSGQFSIILTLLQHLAFTAKGKVNLVLSFFPHQENLSCPKVTLTTENIK